MRATTRRTRMRTQRGITLKMTRYAERCCGSADVCTVHRLEPGTARASRHQPAGAPRTRLLLTVSALAVTAVAPARVAAQAMMLSTAAEYPQWPGRPILTLDGVRACARSTNGRGQVTCNDNPLP